MIDLRVVIALDGTMSKAKRQQALLRAEEISSRYPRCRLICVLFAECAEVCKPPELSLQKLGNLKVKNWKNLFDLFNKILLSRTMATEFFILSDVEPKIIGVEYFKIS